MEFGEWRQRDAWGRCVSFTVAARRMKFRQFETSRKLEGRPGTQKRRRLPKTRKKMTTKDETAVGIASSPLET